VSYYRGDGYYRGDSNYYRGDPFLGALLGGVAKKAAGWLGKAAGRTIGGLARRAIRHPQAVATGIGIGQMIPRRFGPGTVQEMDPIYAEFDEESVGMVKGQCPPGYHPNKAKSAKGPKGSYCVKNRRVNELNPRALKRALRRAEGFEHFARRTVNALRSGPKKFKKVSTRRA